MFVIPCKYTVNSKITELITNISKFHPDEKIMISDSYSSDQSYFEKVHNLVNNKKNLFFCLDNKHYVDSAIWDAFLKFKDEEFFYVLHDSMVIHKNMDLFKNFEFTSFNWFDVTIKSKSNGFHNDMMMYQAKYMIENFTKFKFLKEYTALFGICFISHRSILQKLYDGGLINILPNTKESMCSSERIWGMCLQQIGVDIKKSTIFQSDFTSEYCNKSFLNRI